MVMAPARTPIRSRGPVAALDLGENVDEHESMRRLPNGTIKRVVVGYGFTVQAMTNETMEAFKDRVEHMLDRITTVHDLTLTNIRWHRRQKHRHYATIELATTFAQLPEPNRAA